MKLFGTDGIRGKFNEPPINHNELVKIGYAFAKSLFGKEHGKIFISNDGRESCSVIQSALSSGINHQGSEVIFIGLYPTPALSIQLNQSAATSQLHAGIQITASHNPYFDNGVKFFNNKGHKISNSLEKSIEQEYSNYNESINVKNNQYVKPEYKNTFNQNYINYIDEYFRLKFHDFDNDKKEFNILVDCANGSTSQIISRILKDSFVNIIPIHNEPSGTNINENCGATNTRILKEFVADFNKIGSSSSDLRDTHQHKDLKIDLGVAFDGDGDRAIFISPLGKEINGDDVLYILTLFNKKYHNNIKSIVGTQMTNYGIQDLYKKNNIKFIETDVGDKYVLREMIRSGSNFGGESSGHIIIPVFDDLFVGDGIITLINILEVIFRQDKSIDDLKKEILSIPSKLYNTKVIDKKMFLEDHDNIKVFSNLKKMIGDKGRVLLRPSGTENLVRLLIEHKDIKQIEILSQYFYDNINKNTIV